MVSCGFEVVLSASEVLPDGSGGVISAEFVVSAVVVAVVSAGVALVAVVSVRVVLVVCKTVASDVVCAVLPVMRELEVTDVSDGKDIPPVSGYPADEQAQSRTEPLSNARIKIADNIRFFEKIVFM